MRRKDREVTDFKKILGIVDKCEILRLGLADGDYPYIVPVNFAYKMEGEQLFLYIHGAMAGRKYTLLQKNPRCSFEMDIPIQMDCLEKFGDVTMRYESVMGKAEAEFLDGEDRQRAIDEVIMARHEETKHFKYNQSAVARTAVVRLRVTELSGKANPAKSGPDL